MLSTIVFKALSKLLHCLFGGVPFVTPCFLLSGLFSSLSCLGKHWHTCAFSITWFFFPPFCSSCGSCNIRWLWQQQPHKQPSSIVPGIQVVSQRVKWREACQPLRNSEQDFFFSLSLSFFFYKHKAIEQKELYFYFIFSPKMSVFYIDRYAYFIQKHNLVILSWVKCFPVYTIYRNNLRTTRNIFQRNVVGIYLV